MIRSSGQSALGPIAAVAALLLLCWSCDRGITESSGANSKLASPTEPLAIADVAGHWNQNDTLESVSGCGCVADEFARGIGGTNIGEVEWDIEQNGTAIQGFWGWEEFGSCPFTGTVGQTDFAATLTACNMEIILDCQNGGPRRLIRAKSTWQGALTGNTIKGDWSETYNCFNSENGAALGTLNLLSSFELYR